MFARPPNSKTSGRLTIRSTGKPPSLTKKDWEQKKKIEPKQFNTHLSSRVPEFCSGMGRFIILSGPSCVGKGPLHTAFSKFYPEHAAGLSKLVLYNCRSPRPGETDGKDYQFRSRKEIEELRNKEDFIVLDVRGDLQAVDLNDVNRGLAGGDLFYEGNPFIGRKLLEAFASKVSLLS